MSVKWTAEQERAIFLRDRDLLVSAAAGSGKTAVLVERILQMVTDAKDPIDIDQLLVVTFTRAAAAEMRERIGRQLEEYLERDPDNEHLQRQGVLLRHAQICTIDSFCTYVIQNYFHRIDLDPGYRVADEEELKILRGEVMRAMIEEEIGKGREEFLAFAENLSGTGSMDYVEAYVEKVALYAASDPDPERWLDNCLDSVRATATDELDEIPWIREGMAETRRLLASAAARAERTLARSRGPGGPSGYVAAFAADCELIGKLSAISDYTGMGAALNELSFVRLSGKKKEGENEELREELKKERDRTKEILQKEIRETYFISSPEELIGQMQALRPRMQEFVRLVKLFLARYREEKRKRNILDFSDIEHAAMDILLEKTESGYERTEAAKELAGRFREIMIDEYQDSNLLQEVILSALTGSGRGGRFMVGDIKQSIYGFRMARPKLFLEKYHSYTAEDSDRQRIDLGHNFRSRPEVLDAVNHVFRKLMTGSLGGIEYDEAAALHAGASYPPSPRVGFPKTELLLVETPVAEFERENETAALKKTEALAVADRIRALVAEGAEVYDTKKKEFRPLCYRDCVVLVRSISDEFVRVLQEAGVPAHAESKNGYFSAPEVATVLNFLRICDNPRQDIPYLAVLRSPIADCSDSELALLRITYPELPICEAVRAFSESAGGREDDESLGLRKKLCRFEQMLQGFREEVPHLPVHEFIRRVLRDTGFMEYAGAMPAGMQRQANLRMLVERAVIYEGTSYHGLFHFIRYIENMEKYLIDYGEVNLFGENEDAVRVMTIHKSKGLEFPVVIVAGLGGHFNDNDSKNTVAIHEELGIGLDLGEAKRRILYRSAPKLAIQRAIRRDARAEELRVLYVAMTRASEKLILSGVRKEKSGRVRLSEGALDYSELLGAATYLDWILPTLTPDAPILLQHVNPEELVRAVADRQDGRALRLEEILADASTSDEEARAILEKEKDFRYSYDYLSRMPAKMTVTELKRAYLAELAEETGEELLTEVPVVPYVTKFLRDGEPEKDARAERGTIYHRVWECLDLKGGAEEASIEAQLAAMVAAGKIDAGQRGVVRTEDIRHFLESPLGRRMRAAAAAGKLRREQPFVFNIPAAEIDETLPDQEEILIQGIIDAYFEEDGGLILVDYKTDRVREADELVRRYSVQLSVYARALEQITERPVVGVYIYSLTLGCEIPLAVQKELPKL